MKYIITLAATLIIALLIMVPNYNCDNAYPKEEKAKTIVIHDTIRVTNSQVFDYCMQGFKQSQGNVFYFVSKNMHDSGMYYLGKMKTYIEIEEYVKANK